MKQDIFYNGKIFKNCEKRGPQFTKGELFWLDVSCKKIMEAFEYYLSTLTSYRYDGNDLKDGQVVIENADYVLVKAQCDLRDINTHTTTVRLELKAIPKEPSPTVEEGKEDEAAAMWEEVMNALCTHKYAADFKREMQNKFTIQRK